MCGEDLELDGRGQGGSVQDEVEASTQCEAALGCVSDAVIDDDAYGGPDELGHGPCEQWGDDFEPVGVKGER